MEVRLRGRYELKMAPGREEAPKLHFSMTRSVSEDFTVVHLRNGVFELQARWALKPNAMRHMGTARLCLQAFTRMLNDHNERCQVPAGAARVALAELIATHRRRPIQMLRVELLFPMFDGTSPEAHKGFLLFELQQCTMSVSGRSVSDLVPPDQWQVPRLQYSPLEGYIERQERRFGPDGMQSTWSMLERVNLFRYQSEIGMAPAAAYFDPPLSATGEEYYLNAASLALRMQGLTEAQAFAWQLDRSPDDCRFASYWLAALLSLYTQSCDYIGDQVCVQTTDGDFQVRPVEAFQMARIRDGSIDCEDAAMETMVEGLELERLRTHQPLLMLAQRVKRAFYVMLLLDGVSAVEINLAQAPRHMAAHMNSALVNRAQLHRWSPQMCAKHAPSADELQWARLFPPIVMLEGTGPLDPNGIEHGRDDNVGERAMQLALSSEPLLPQSMRRVYHYDATGRQQSGFYKVTKVAATAELHARGGCGQFLWVLEPRDKRTAGVTFQEMAAASDSVLAVPEEELTPSELTEMHQMLLDTHPQPVLLAPSQASPGAAVLRSRTQMASLLERVRTLRRPRDSGRPLHVMRQDAKYEHFDEHGSFADALYRSLDTAQRRGNLTLVDFHSEEYQVTPDRGFWQLTYSIQAPAGEDNDESAEIAARYQ